MCLAEEWSLLIRLGLVRSMLISDKPRKSTCKRSISSMYSVKSPPDMPKLRPQGLPKYSRKTWSGLLSGIGGPMKSLSLRFCAAVVSVSSMRVYREDVSGSWLVGIIGQIREGGIHTRISRSLSGFTWWKA